MNVIVKRKRRPTRTKPAFMATWVSIADNTAFVELARAANVSVGFAMEFALKRAMGSLEFRRELALYGEESTKATPREVSRILAVRGRRFRAMLPAATDGSVGTGRGGAGDPDGVERPRLYGCFESIGRSPQRPAPIEAEARAA